MSQYDISSECTHELIRFNPPLSIFPITHPAQLLMLTSLHLTSFLRMKLGFMSTRACLSLKGVMTCGVFLSSLMIQCVPWISMDHLSVNQPVCPSAYFSTLLWVIWKTGKGLTLIFSLIIVIEIPEWEWFKLEMVTTCGGAHLKS